MINPLKLMSLEDIIKKLTLFVGIFSLAIIFSVLIWASNKSFDFTDESYYAIGYSFNIGLDNTVLFFHKIYNFFFSNLNLTLAQNRLFGLILAIVCSVTLAYNSFQYLNIKNKIAKTTANIKDSIKIENAILLSSL